MRKLPPPDVVQVPVGSIVVLNPRARNAKAHREIVENIEKVGLKRPISVRRASGPGEADRYELVCGQGRLEAFRLLGQAEIPAIILDVEQDDAYLMSLVENIARRKPRPAETLEAIGTLKERGYSDEDVAKKIGYSVMRVSMIAALLNNGERRLLAAVEQGKMPIGLALEIARNKDKDVQELLVGAYESGELKARMVGVVRRVLERRDRIGKRTSDRGGTAGTKKLTPEALTSLYQKEAERHKLMHKKAEFARSTVLFAMEAFKDLLQVPDFLEVLRIANLESVPQLLADSGRSSRVALQ